MSLLDRLLASLDVRVNAFAICEVRRGWSLVLDGMAAPLIHYVLKGSGILRPEQGPAIRFAAHDFIILPSRVHHSIEEPGGMDLQQIRRMDNVVALADGLLAISTPDDTTGNAPDIVTACGTIEATYGGSLGLFDGMREPIAVHLGEDDPLRRAVEALLAELASPGLGTRALTEALLKQCLILLVRRMADEEAAKSGWLFGAADPRLVEAVIKMLENPAHDHTLASLAASAGMSRHSARSGRSPFKRSGFHQCAQAGRWRNAVGSPSVSRRPKNQIRPALCRGGEALPVTLPVSIRAREQ
ncbi:MAG: cupin domain-containing protein [Rhizobiales bacterium]|nr:cupin domain-containing protein [Hyphomicrobiales bacterium]